MSRNQLVTNLCFPSYYELAWLPGPDRKSRPVRMNALETIKPDLASQETDHESGLQNRPRNSKAKNDCLALTDHSGPGKDTDLNHFKAIYGQSLYPITPIQIKLSQSDNAPGKVKLSQFSPVLLQ